MPDIWNKPIVHKDTPIREMYREVRTPQTPPCQHAYESSWGFSGPIMVCTKCGHWHHD